MIKKNSETLIQTIQIIAILYLRRVCKYLHIYIYIHTRQYYTGIYNGVLAPAIRIQWFRSSSFMQTRDINGFPFGRQRIIDSSQLEGVFTRQIRENRKDLHTVALSGRHIKRYYGGSKPTAGLVKYIIFYCCGERDSARCSGIRVPII